MSNLIRRLNELGDLDLKNINFLVNINNNFKKNCRKDYVFLIENSVNNDGKPLDLVVNNVNAKRDILHFAIANNYEVPNIYISELSKNKIYCPIYLRREKTSPQGNLELEEFMEIFDKSIENISTDEFCELYTKGFSLS